jgi:hypothetical protein
MLRMGRLNRTIEARSTVTTIGTVAVRLESFFTGQGTGPLLAPATAAAWRHGLPPMCCDTGDPRAQETLASSKDAGWASPAHITFGGDRRDWEWRGMSAHPESAIWLRRPPWRGDTKAAAASSLGAPRASEVAF